MRRSRIICASVLALALSGIAPKSVNAFIENVDIGRGPVNVHIPDNSEFDPTQPAPLLILLHGFSSNGFQQEAFYQLKSRADAKKWLYTYPDGRFLPDTNIRYWDGVTPTFTGDVEYLLDLIDAIDEIVVDDDGQDVELTVHPKRIYIIGFSNGGAMAYRMACEATGRIAAIISVSGYMYMPENADDDPATGEEYCQPSRPIRVAHVHGTNDPNVDYDDGGSFEGFPFPPAQVALGIWRDINECISDVSGPNEFVDFVTGLDGFGGVPEETFIQRWPSGCHINGSTEFWRVDGAEHSIFWNNTWRDMVFEFFDRYERQMMVFDDKNTITYPAVPGAESYDLSRGILNAQDGFLDGDGDGLPDAGYGTCVSEASPDDEDLIFVDPTPPLPGEMIYYVRGQTDDLPAGGNLGQFGMTSGGRDRVNTCPEP